MPTALHTVGMATTSNAASESIIRQQKALLESLPFSDTQDFDDAHRGLVGRRQPNAVTAEDGTVLWDNDTYSFLQGDAPDTVNPSLWRQARLDLIHGLFEVVPGITSAIAGPAYAGIPVTHREFCSSVHIITGQRIIQFGRVIIETGDLEEDDE